MTQAQDWSAYEVQEEPKLNPEVDASQFISLNADEIDRRISVYREKVNMMFIPKDEASITECALFVAGCKVAADYVERERDALVRPLNAKVDEYNKPRIKVREFFKTIGNVVVERVNKFNEDKKKAAELKQQEINAEAARKQAELDRKAQEAKAKAAQALESGDEVAATVLESKAAILEQKAAEVVPMQVAVPNGKVELETSTVSFGGAKKVWSLNGWDKKKPLRVLDPALAALVGDLSKLPEGVRFILQHSDLNHVYLNASYKGGMKFPAPFAEVNDYSGSRVR